MKLKRLVIRKFKNIQAFTPVLVVGLLVAVGAVIYNFNARAANPGFYFTSSATSYRVGDTISVGVYENSDANCANVVQADFTYPANLLQYESFSASGSKFEASAPSDSSAGRVSITQYTTRKECGSGASATSGVSGTQIIGTATFRVIAAGTANLAFQGSSIAISAADNKTNVAPGMGSRSLALSAPVVVTPPPPPPPSNPGPPPANPGPPPRPTTPPSNPGPRPVTPPSRPPSQPVTNAQPVASDTAVPLQNNDVIEVNDPIEFSPLPVQPDGITKVEYYMNGKLVATSKTPPYTFTLDQSKYLNGKYTMTTKTFYSNGQTRSVNQTIVIKNKFGFGQMKLWAQKYAWLIILLLLVLGAAVAAWIIHRRGSGPDNYYGDGSFDNVGDYTVSSDNYGTVQDDTYTGIPAAPQYQPQPAVQPQAPQATYEPAAPVAPPAAPVQPTYPVSAGTQPAPQVITPTQSPSDPVTPSIKL